MKSEIMRLLATFILLAAAGPSASVAEPDSITAEHDIGTLLKRARESFDVSAEDAVFLLDETRESWTHDGRLVRSVHRIVYVNTALAVRRYADLRVPYDSARQRFVVTALRTWRPADRRWIESGPTARVETLPFALDRAPDYAHRREMMLLHDGVELPCVVETAYTIEDSKPYRPGIEGVWNFSRAEPAVVSRLVLEFPEQSLPHYEVFGDTPEARRGRVADLDLETLTFEMTTVGAHPDPPTSGSLRELPHVVWSTWKDWPSLGRALEDRFNASASVDEPLRERITEHVEEARTEAEKARLIAEFVAESTRLIDHEIGWWPSPRAAARTWASAYADRIDRAVLAAALFREMGFDVELATWGPRHAAPVAGVPSLHWAEGPVLRIEGEYWKAGFDPAAAELLFGPAAFVGRPVWSLGQGDSPVIGSSGEVDDSDRLELRFDLSLDEEQKKWVGTGVMTATGVLCPFEHMVGLDSESREYLERFVDAVFEGAKLLEYNLAAFTPLRVVAGFGVEITIEEPEDRQRIALEFRDPGAVSSLFEDSAVRMYEQQRGSAAYLPSMTEQIVELHLDFGDLKPVHIPVPRALENWAGEFTSDASEAEGKITLKQRLFLSRKTYPPERWDELRALLLADSHERGRRLLFE
ncbi:MAG: DUF3857 domain-containing protein [Acidobacteriota bacterium]|nr:MAG: DUF3857 domain-containing protein [Acidobacteriota bacterium]